MKTSRIVATGFAIFAMLFGSGNVIFPLTLGRDIGHQVWFGLLGFMLTAVLIPLIGLVSTILADGDYKKFLGKLGVIPGNIVILVCMGLIGPFGVIPRCIATSHGALAPYVSWLSVPIFSVIAASIILGCTIRSGFVVDLLGKYLGPLKLTLLLSIVVIGLFNPAPFVKVGLSVTEAFNAGLSTGLGTVDLLGTIFFAGLIFASLRRGVVSEKEISAKELVIVGLKAGLLGSGLLGLVYAGFCVVAAYRGAQLVAVSNSAQLFPVLARLVLGHTGGLLANVTLALSCLTTAIALSIVFAGYLHKEILCEQISYFNAQMITIAIAAVMSNLGFTQIMVLIKPIIVLIYPALIVLAIMHLVYKLCDFEMIKIPVGITFLMSLALKYFI
jgi:LIVCS family branched-chain amino acid:cation transporter